MRRFPSPLLTLCLVLAALGVGGRSVAAQSISNPYGEPESTRPKPARDLDQARPEQPLLDAMEGQIPVREPGATRPPDQDQDSIGADQPVPSASSSPKPEAREGHDYRPGTVGREELPGIAPQPPSRDGERADLVPQAPAGSESLPHELWRGLPASEIERLFASLTLPPRSPALAALWRRLITSDAGRPAGDDADRVIALRMDALDRSGHTDLAVDLMAHQSASGAPKSLLLELITARLEISSGDRAIGCAGAKTVAGTKAAIPPLMKAEAILMTGYCVAADGNAQGAGIAAELARESGAENRAGLVALEAISTGIKPDISGFKAISFVDYRVLELAGLEADAVVAAHASPGLAAHLARDRASRPAVRLAAGELAVRLNAIEPGELMDVYTAQSDFRPAESLLSDASADGIDPGLRRALLAKAAMAERTPQKKARLIRAFLDDSRRNGFYAAALTMMAVPAAQLLPAAEIGWFTETAIETALLAGEFERARSWIAFGASLDRPAGTLNHWAALIEIAAPRSTGERATPSPAIESLVRDGRFDPQLLHRLVTVIDALAIPMPIPLWEGASRTPQPSSGHLPETGVLSALEQASKKQEFGHTVLLAMKTLGPDGSEGAHMIALGDSIRALRRAGLEKEARQLGLEALFEAWPRASST